MKCKNCYTENAQGNLYCEECGTEFEKCPVCGKTHVLRTFCPNTGKNINEAALERKKQAALLKFIIFTNAATKKTEILIFILAIACGLLGGYFAYTKTMSAVSDMGIKVFVALLISVAIAESIYFPFYDWYKHKSTLKFKKEFAKKYPDEAKYLD